MTADDFREIALGLEGVVELTPEEQKEFLRSHAKAWPRKRRPRST